jgi:hypothetical protein
MDRDRAVDRLETLVDRVASEPMPVPVREVWAFGDVALGLDPVERLDVYVTKDVLLRDDAPDRLEELEARFGVKGIGRTVRAAWAEANPALVRANDNGHVAPEKCLAAHLLPDGVPAHLEVCNTGFQDNVTQRLQGALGSGQYERALDPRGVCLWADGGRSPSAFEQLRAGGYVFPTLAEALSMFGAESDQTEAVAAALREYRATQDGTTVRGDVV